MIKQGLSLKRISTVLFFVAIASNSSCSKTDLTIYSYILRDRVIVTDRVLMKKALYVAFSVTRNSTALKNKRVMGQLLCNGEILSKSGIEVFNERNGNIIFDLPYEIPDGRYTINIQLLDRQGRRVGQNELMVRRKDLKSSFRPKAKEAPVVGFEEIRPETVIGDFGPSNQDIANGYAIFSRSPLEYIFPGSRPRKVEIVDRISVKAVRNEFEPFNFAIYPLRDLGKVQVRVGNLVNTNGIIPKEKIRIGHVESIQETIRLPPGKFQNIPALIRPGNQVEVVEGKCQRFWFTIGIDKDVPPGEYSGKVIISPEYGKVKSLPIKVIVAPITLEDIPGIDYFMLMTYEFTELSMPWEREDKEKIYKSACNILKDYKEHGMTTLCLHSPFVLITNNDGTPNLEDIFAALRAARDIGLKRPIIWYMGHLIQTSKPKHPGSIMGFDQEIHLPRLKYLVETVTRYAKDNGCPEIIFLPVDEADDSYQDFKNKRHEITPLLLRTIKELGAKNMLTTRKYDQFGPLDYLCSSELDQKNLQGAHSNGCVYWMYNNQVTIDCKNPAYARYIYGYYVWKNNIDGMSSWTFQNTQNASGFPTKADGFGNDIYLAYPDPNGPLATPKWEAVREGIEDHKLVYQLLKRIDGLKKNGINTSKFETFLASLRQKQGAPGTQAGDYQEWGPVFFRESKDALISMILDADKQFLPR
jgi:hypothetical protein